MNWIFFLLVMCCFVSAIVQRVSGFGLATLLMPLLLIFMDFSDALLITGVVCCAGSIILGIQNHRYIQWKNLLIPMIPYMVLGYLIGRFMALSNAAGLRRWLGLFLFALALYLIFISKKSCIKVNKYTGIAVGSVTGVTNTLFNVAGPPMAIYFLGECKDNRAYLATMQVFLAFITLYTNVVRAVNGMFYIEILPALIIGIGSALLGFWIGGKVFDKLNADKLKNVVYLVVAASGIWLFIEDVLGISA